MNRDLHTVIVGILVVMTTLSGTVGAVSTGLSGAPVEPSSNGDSIGPTAAEDPEVNRSPQTADEFLHAFESLQSTSALGAYGEFEVVRVQAIIRVQAGEFGEQDRTRMRLLLRALRQFSDAYRLMENGSLERSLAVADRSDRALSRLDDAGGGRYSRSADIGLTRFYRDLGNQLSDRVRKVNRTPEEISLLESAATAFRKGDSPEQFARESARAENKSAEYQQDRREMNESVVAAKSFLDDCGSACGSPTAAIMTYKTDLFGLYNDGRRARADISQAVALANNHKLSDQKSQYRQLRQSITGTVLTLIQACAIVAGVYVATLGLPAMLVSLRLSSWARDRRAERVGSVLTPVPATEGYDAPE